MHANTVMEPLADLVDVLEDILKGDILALIDPILYWEGC